MGVPLHKLGCVQPLYPGPLPLHYAQHRRNVGEAVEAESAHLCRNLRPGETAQEPQQHGAAAQIEANVGDWDRGGLFLLLVLLGAESPVDPARTCFLLDFYAFLKQFTGIRLKKIYVPVPTYDR